MWFLVSWEELPCRPISALPLPVVDSEPQLELSIPWVALGDLQVRGERWLAVVFSGLFVKWSQARHWRKNWISINHQPHPVTLWDPLCSASAASLKALSTPGQSAWPVHLGVSFNGWAFQPAGGNRPRGPWAFC